MDPISVVGNTNLSYPKQGNVIPTVQRKSLSSDVISFNGNHKSEEKKSNAGLWLLGGLAVATGLGIIFRKNISMLLKDFRGCSQFTKSTENLLEKAETREICSYDVVLEHIKKNYFKEKTPAGHQAIVCRLDDKMKKIFNITHKEAIVLGYSEKGFNGIFAGDNTFTHIILADKLDDKLVKSFADTNLMIVNVLKDGVPKG